MVAIEGWSEGQKPGEWSTHLETRCCFSWCTVWFWNCSQTNKKSLLLISLAASPVESDQYHNPGRVCGWLETCTFLTESQLRWCSVHHSALCMVSVSSLQWRTCYCACCFIISENVLASCDGYAEIGCQVILENVSSVMPTAVFSFTEAAPVGISSSIIA